jgi:hypothetical protein
MFQIVFQKPSACLVITRDSILFSSPSVSIPQRIQFPESVVEFGEIKDSNKFDELTKEFFHSLNSSHKKIIILLSPDIVYMKKILPSESKNFTKIAIEFENKVPMNSEMIIKSVLKTEKGTVLFVANKELVSETAAVCKAFHCKVLHIIPAQALGIPNNSLPSYNDLVSSTFRLLRNNSSVDFVNQI